MYGLSKRLNTSFQVLSEIIKINCEPNLILLFLLFGVESPILSMYSICPLNNLSMHILKCG